jgi:two-component system sensor histidine kinase FlrB
MLYAGHLGRPAVSDDDRLRFAGRVMERLRHLERLTEDMLRFVKGVGDSRAAFEAAAVLAETLQVMEPHAASRGVVLAGEDHSCGARVLGSQPAVLAALVSLAENAVEAAPSGSTVSLVARFADGTVSFMVSDRGTGIAPDAGERIFEPFFTTREAGTGLGLAIVRTVAESHGGRVSFRSEPGQGAEFELALPAVPA